MSRKSKKRQGATSRAFNQGMSNPLDDETITGNVVDPKLELTDPTPNVHRLFESFDARCFGGRLKEDHVLLEWSTNMDPNIAGGTFKYRRRDHKTKSRIKIELNERLLKYRSRKDLVETLLHEMIHSALFIDNSDDDHGPNFQNMMNRINEETGASIGINHHFTDERAFYENRLYRCNGICRSRPPKFGYVRNETVIFDDLKDQRWWSCHSRTCGGNFELVKSE